MFLLGLCLMVEYHTYRATHDMQERITFKVDVAQDISDGAAQILKTQIEAIENVKHVDYISRDEAAEIFSQALGVNFKRATHKGNRKGCACMESRGLGDYNSCPNGCRYCYANKDHRKALENYRRHDPSSPLLLGNILPTDIIKPAKQTSLLDKEPKLF